MQTNETNSRSCNDTTTPSTAEIVTQTNTDIDAVEMFRKEFKIIGDTPVNMSTELTPFNVATTIEKFATSASDFDSNLAKLRIVKVDSPDDGIGGMDERTKKIISVLDFAEKNGTFRNGSDISLKSIYKYQDYEFFAGLKTEKDGKQSVAIQIGYEDGSRSGMIELAQEKIIKFARGVAKEPTINPKLLMPVSKAQPHPAIVEMRKIVHQFDNQLLPYIRLDIGIIDSATSKKVLQEILNNYGNLPHVTLENPYNIKQLYAHMLDYMMENLHECQYVERKSCYAFGSDTFENIANGVNMKASEFAKVFKDSGMLSLTASSKGYQTKVKNEGWCYCVRKLTIILEESTEISNSSNDI